MGNAFICTGKQKSGTGRRLLIQSENKAHKIKYYKLNKTLKSLVDSIEEIGTHKGTIEFDKAEVVKDIQEGLTLHFINMKKDAKKKDEDKKWKDKRFVGDTQFEVDVLKQLKLQKVFIGNEVVWNARIRNQQYRASNKESDWVIEHPNVTPGPEHTTSDTGFTRRRLSSEPLIDRIMRENEEERLRNELRHSTSKY